MKQNNDTTFLITPSIEKVQKGVENAVRNNKWICINGRAGSGKTTIKDYYVHNYILDEQKYIVIEQQSFTSKFSRVNALMGRMLGAIDSTGAVPQDVESRYIRLRTALLKANRTKHKVIIIIDEAQDCNKQTLRDLKKIHELSGPGQRHLFSIIMFSKDSIKMDALLDSQELGYRIHRYDLYDLSNDDIIFFAENYGVSFGKGESVRKKKNYFVQIADPTPLSVRNFCDHIRENKDFEGVIKLEHIQRYASRTQKDRLKSMGVRFSFIQKRYRETHNKKMPSMATISLSLDNKINTKLAQDIRSLADGILAEKTKERMCAE